MAPDPSAASQWAGAAADLEGIPKGRHRLTVRAEGADGAVGRETIEILIGRPDADDPARRFADGSDRNAIGAWSGKGILGTQLGPNRNGRKW
jgi:3',5'-cyclic-AMP phosphodiesterase